MDKSESGSGGESAAERAQKIAENIIAIQQKTQDIRISLIEDGFTREADIINTNYDRQIEQLKERAEKEVQLREVINQQIIALESARHKELLDFIFVIMMLIDEFRLHLERIEFIDAHCEFIEFEDILHIGNAHHLREQSPQM